MKDDEADEGGVRQTKADGGRRRQTVKARRRGQMTADEAHDADDGRREQTKAAEGR